ncbi:hypothetical protein V8C44DRAFT_291526 [Trichoderma aethiopicum]
MAGTTGHTHRSRGNRALAKPNNSWGKANTSRTLPHAPGLRTAHSMISFLPTDHECCSAQGLRPYKPEPPDGSVDVLLILLCHSKFVLGLSSPPRLTLTGVCATSSSQEQRKALVVERICNAHARLKHAAAPRRWSMRRCLSPPTMIRSCTKDEALTRLTGCARRLDDPAEAWYFRKIRYVDGT